MSAPPVLWQYSFSNFNEKARWALDHKGVAHVRRSLFPGSPRQMAFMARGTLPVLEIDGERIMDSTAIIAAIEERFDGPSLYPADPNDRVRALELEDFFDENAGHEVRRAFFWEYRDDAALITEMLSTDQPPWARGLIRVGLPVAWQFMKRRYRFYEADAAEARGSLREALDRIEVERGGRDFLVGDAFTVADLTAAALMYPFALPCPSSPIRFPRCRQRGWRSSSPITPRSSGSVGSGSATAVRLPPSADRMLRDQPGHSQRLGLVSGRNMAGMDENGFPKRFRPKGGRSFSEPHYGGRTRGVANANRVL